MIRCPQGEGEKEAEIPLGSLRSGPNGDTHALPLVLPFLKVPSLEHGTRAPSAWIDGPTYEAA